MKNKLIKKTIDVSKIKISERRYEDLEFMINQGLSVYPDNLNFKCLKAIANKNLNKDYYGEILEIKDICSKDSNLANTVGVFFLDLEEIDLAKEFFKINKEKEESCLNLGICFRLEKNFKKSLKYIKKAYKINKKSFNVLMNLAGLYAENLEIEKSIKYLKKALEINPNSSKAHVDLGCSYYLQGKLNKAFKHYQYRFEEFENLKKIKEVFSKQNWKKWQGENIEDGKTILFFSEQGIGDAINFIRFVENFKERFEKVNVKVIIPAQVDNLFSMKEGELVKDKDFKIEDFSKYDFYCSIIDLPYYLKMKKKEINESFKPYIFANKKCDYSHFDGFFKIGICWAGNPKHARDKERSCKLSLFEEINKIPNVKIFSLQKELSPRIRPYEKDPVNLADCSSFKIINMSPHMKTWEDTVSIVGGLDLVISVDTSILHLAAAMGKETFGLLPFFPDWRWQTFSKESYWYPTLKLFRQPQEGDWKSVFKDVVNYTLELSNLKQNKF